MKYLVCLMFLVSIITLDAQPVQPDGTGTAGDPYQIATLDNLLWISANPTDWDMVYLQTADIDASDTQNWDSGDGFIPLGSAAAPFTGVYDGGGFAIDSLTINRPTTNEQALFGYTSGSEIRNLELINCTITGDTRVAGIVANHRDNSVLSSCRVTGTITGNQNVGGLVGFNRYSSVIELSCNEASVSVNTSGGGIAGKNGDTSMILHCYNTGSITGSTEIGGIAGYNLNSTIIFSYSACQMTCPGTTGGITAVGTTTDVINSLWNTETSGTATSMGGIGLSTTQMKVLDSYTGIGWDFQEETVNGGQDIWGMHFLDHDGYPFLSWQGFEHYPPAGNEPAGNGTQTNPYTVNTLDHLRWVSSHPGSWDKFFEQNQPIDAMASQSWGGGKGFSPIGTIDIPFTGDWNGHFNDITNLEINRPDQSRCGFFGTCEDPAYLNKIDLVNASVSSRHNSGILCGRATLITINKCSVSGNIIGVNRIGMLVGWAFGVTPVQCQSTGSVTGESNVGGLIGYAQQQCDFLQCSSSGTVNGTDRVGGLAGNCGNTVWIRESRSDADVNCPYTGTGFYYGGFIGQASSYCWIRDCYAAGTVSSGGNSSGGFIGGNMYESVVERCYSYGEVVNTGSTNGGFAGMNVSADIVDCFWDREASGQYSSDGGMGRTTEQMTQLINFLEHQWDMTGETLCGTEDMWGMNANINGGRPFLIWEGYNNTAFGTIPPAGWGTQNNPYILIDPGDVAWIGINPDQWDRVFHLLIDLNLELSHTIWGSQGFYPIGNSETPFTGTFDGLDCTLDSLFISMQDSNNTGFFGNVDGCAIENLHLTNVSITGNLRTGGLVGNALNATLDNCSAAGSVTGNERAGGLIGNAEGCNIQNCSSSAVVNGTDATGGLIGFIGGCDILNCSSSANVNGNDFTGGLAGSAEGCDIQGCASSAIVNGNDSTGGLAGKIANSTLITGCSSNADVSGNTWVGGLVGVATDNGTQITESVSTATVSGLQRTGGFIGKNKDFAWIHQCHSDATVTGGMAGQFYYGGFVGLNDFDGLITNSYAHGIVDCNGNSSAGFVGGNMYGSDILNCYSTTTVTNSGNSNMGFSATNYQATTDYCFWDIQTSTQNDSEAGTGLSTALMQSPGTFLSAGWDWMDEDTNGTADIWGMNFQVNNGYPFLAWEGFDNLTYGVSQPDGTGTQQDPYLIDSLNDLGWLSVSPDSWNAHFLLTASINAAHTAAWDGGEGLRPIGNEDTSFTGTFDGQHFVIDSLTINRPAENEQALFGNVFQAEIRNTHVHNCFITGDNRTAALVGNNSAGGLVVGCSATGSVSGSNATGGLVGMNEYASEIRRCFNAAEVHATVYHGGICGRNQGNSVITDCYNLGTILGSGTLGGLLGENLGSTVQRCFSAGQVLLQGTGTASGLIGDSVSGTETACVWDTDASGQNSSDGQETGYTSPEMQQYTLYDSLGWDFVLETTNGTNDIWNMDGASNSGYPWLAWQNITPIAPQAPQNLMIDISGGNVNLTWDPAGGPVGYKVYSCQSPDGTFTEDTSGTLDGTGWSAPEPGRIMFYQVTAYRYEPAVRQATTRENHRQQ